MLGKFSRLMTIMLKMIILSTIYADKAVCEAIEIPVKDPSQNTIIGNIKVSINDQSGFDMDTPEKRRYKIYRRQGRITAVFTPVESLEKTSAMVHGNHFNWINIVVKGENALFPEAVNSQTEASMWVDPLPGGNQGRGVHAFDDDHHPFFWSEQDIKEKGVMAEIHDSSVGNVCVFTDCPLNQKNSVVHFETYLVSVVDKIGETQNRKFYVVGGFSWKSITNRDGKREKISDLKPIEVVQHNANEVVGKVNVALAMTSTFKMWQAIHHIGNEKGSESILVNAKQSTAEKMMGETLEQEPSRTEEMIRATMLSTPFGMETMTVSHTPSKR